MFCENYIVLSYPITATTPQYGQERPDITIEPRKQIQNGDSSNTFRVCMENHIGTHIDFPKHFHSNGKSVLDYEGEELIFREPYLCDVNLESGQLLQADIIEKEIPDKTDILLIRSGWSKKRSDKVYTTGNPGISLEFAHHIRNNYTSIRAIGFDFVSATSFLNREIGREVHRILLNDGSPILIIEDMNLDLFEEENGHNYIVAVFPYWKLEIDSSPCMVLAVRNHSK